MQTYKNKNKIYLYLLLINIDKLLIYSILGMKK